jgi:hypothetical protein
MEHLQTYLILVSDFQRVIALFAIMFQVVEHRIEIFEFLQLLDLQTWRVVIAIESRQIIGCQADQS